MWLTILYRIKEIENCFGIGIIGRDFVSIVTIQLRLSRSRGVLLLDAELMGYLLMMITLGMRGRGV
jgi:hypothetical protein